MDFHFWFLLLFYGFSLLFKVFEVVHFIHQKRLEKKIAESLDELGKFNKTLKP